MSDAWMFPNVPGLGGGPWFSTGTSGLSSAQQQYAQNQAYYAQQAAAQQAAQVPQSQLYGGGSFGAQPAYYAGVGAAYGRAVPASSPAAVAAQNPAMGSLFQGYPSGSVERGPDLPDLSQDPFNPYLATLSQQSSYNPFSQYASGGYDPFASIYGRAAQGNIGSGYGGSATTVNGGPDLSSFNSMWGNTPWTAGSGYSLPNAITAGTDGGIGPGRFPGGGMSAGEASQADNILGLGGQYPGGINSGNWMDAYRAGNAAALRAQTPYNDYNTEGRMGSFSPSPSNYPGTSPSVPPQPAGGQFFPQPDYASMLGRSGLGLGTPQINLGYNPGMENYFANSGMNANSFQGRFGMGFPNAGTPSQYYTGNQYGGGDYGFSGMLPPGFSTPFSANNPGGALPVGGFRMDQQ